MTKAALIYKSIPKTYAIICYDTPYRGAVNEVLISEDFFKYEKLDHISPSLGDYQIIIVTDVKDSSEIQSKHFEIKKIIHELDLSWMYACGHPLSKKVLSFIGPYLDFPDGKING